MQHTTSRPLSLSCHFLLVPALTATCLANLACNSNPTQTTIESDLAIEISTLKNEVATLSKQNELKKEQLAALNADIPGGLPMGEREKLLEEKEARLSSLEKELEQEKVEAHVATKNMRSDQVNFAKEHQEMLIQMGEARQINEHYAEILKDKEEALLGERSANLRVERSIRLTMILGAVTFVALLVTLAHRAKLKAERKRIEATIRMIDPPAWILGNSGKRYFDREYFHDGDD